MNDHEKGGVAIGNTKVTVLVTGEQTSSRYALRNRLTDRAPGSGLADT
jgi:hypothetical protein